MSVEDQDPLADRFAAFRHDYPYRETSCRGMVWRYRAGGTADRPTVLVLPGATLVPDPLFVVVQALGRRHRVIAPAYPPAGTIADLVAGVIAVLDAERVATAHVVEGPLKVHVKSPAEQVVCEPAEGSGGRGPRTADTLFRPWDTSPLAE